MFLFPGKEVDLPPAAEEVAGFYAAMLETEHAQDATFNKNFFEDWKTLMKEHPPVSYCFFAFSQESIAV
jgi:DNA topoisomerase I